MQHLIFTVTNSLAYDQRMIRICTSLASAGYNVTLVGMKNSASSPLSQKPFNQKRLTMWFNKGPGFYAEYNCRLFFYLLFARADLLCCIDLDTIIPVWLVSLIRSKKRIYDAHEYFSQQKEIITRPAIYKIWHGIERFFVPRFSEGYTVGNKIAAELKKNYKVDYEVIRNIPILKSPGKFREGAHGKYILYQGAVNEARGLEYLVPAMKQVDAILLIYGDGNFMAQIKRIIESNNLSHKVFLKGKLVPEDLDIITSKAYIGVNLVENIGLNQYYSLANKFFDYIHHLIPQVTMDFPEYRIINEEFEVGLLVKNLDTDTIVNSLNRLLNDDVLYEKISNNCKMAREQLNWQQEEKKLLAFYLRLMGNK